MACTNCSQTKTTVTPCASGCATTINTDCVIYDQDPLCFEDSEVEDGDKRTLSDLLQLIQCGLTKESKFIEFTSAENTQYTVVEGDTSVILLITFADEGYSGAVTRTINLPQTSEFINKEIIIKDISTQLGDAVLSYQFNIQIQYDWNPLSTSNDFHTLADPTHKTLKLRFIKTSDVSYQWVVCP